MNFRQPARRATALAAAACAAACPFVSFAQTADSAPVDPVVITATRTPQRLSDALPHTTVLTRADIEAAQAIDLPALLAAEAGVQVSGNGGRGTATSLLVRGAAARQVLVLVDGVPLARQDASGQVGIEHLMLDQVERIEVVRGNLSAVYGSGAIGGVIQVFTRRAGAGGPQASAVLEAGARGLLRGGVQAATTVGATELSFGLSRVRDTGFSALNPTELPAANPDRDGYANTSASLNLRHRWAPEQSLALSFSQTEGRLDFDSAFDTPADVQQSRTQKRMTSLSSQNRLGAGWSSTLVLSRQTDDARYLATGDFGFTARYLTTVTSLNWLNTLALGPGLTVTAGLDRQRQQIGAESLDSFGGSHYDVSRSLWAVFGGAQWRQGAHEASLTLRHDALDGQASPNSAALGWGWTLAPQWKLIASVGNAFSLAPLGYLYDPFSGNPNLLPERSHHTELGLQWTAGAQRLRATLFDTRTSQEIDYSTTTFTFENLARTRNRGLELSFDGRLSGGDWRASLTLQDPVDASSGAQRLRRSRALASLSVTQPLAVGLNGLRAGAALRWVGERPDTGSYTLPAYLVADLTAQWAITPQWQAFGRIENVGNVRYQTARTYNQAPRGLFAGLRWTL